MSCSKLSLVTAKEINGNLNIESFDVRAISIYGEMLGCIIMDTQRLFKEDICNVGKIKPITCENEWYCKVLSDDEEKTIHEIWSEYEKFKTCEV